MADPLVNPNCKSDLDPIAQDWDGWLQDKLWGPRSWLALTSRLISEAIPDHRFPEPPEPPGKLYPNVKGKSELKEGLRTACERLRAYAREMTAAVEQAHRHHVTPLPKTDTRRQLLNTYLQFLKDERDALSVPDPWPWSNRGICGAFSGWARRYNRWGILLFLWENLAATVVPRDAKAEVLQVPPPPWPPWPDFDEDAPDALAADYVEDGSRAETF